MLESHRVVRDPEATKNLATFESGDEFDRCRSLVEDGESHGTIGFVECREEGQSEYVFNGRNDSQIHEYQTKIADSARPDFSSSPASQARRLFAYPCDGYPAGLKDRGNLGAVPR